ncbi:hypothetical protein KM043_004705 [Ampulex compressa]|nr:hypothetical protein KM043_004705 [Ampulex compressa]
MRHELVDERTRTEAVSCVDAHGEPPEGGGIAAYRPSGSYPSGRGEAQDGGVCRDDLFFPHGEICLEVKILGIKIPTEIWGTEKKVWEGRKEGQEEEWQFFFTRRKRTEHLPTLFRGYG